MKTTAKVILGMAAAAAAGAAIGMLLAPEKGSDLQKKLKEGAREWLDQVSELMETGKEIAAQVKDRAVTNLHQLKAGTHDN